MCNLWYEIIKFIYTFIIHFYTMNETQGRDECVNHANVKESHDRFHTSELIDE